MTALDDLFRNQRLRPDEIPSPFIFHRFLASKPDYAQVARQVQLAVRDPLMVYEVWRAAIPATSTGAPRLRYTGHRRAKGADALVARVMTVEKLNRVRAEEAVEAIASAGRMVEARRYYGVE